MSGRTDAIRRRPHRGPVRAAVDPQLRVHGAAGLRGHMTSNSHSEYPYWVARAVPYMRM